MELNPYKIYWGLAVLEEGFSFSPAQVKTLNKASVTGSVSPDRSYFFFHAPAHLIDERMQNVINNLAYSSLKGKLYQITDKQYGMINNSWNGKTPEVALPFRHSVVLKQKNSISVVPVSEKQLSESISF
jgi:hypothetical protein